MLVVTPSHQHRSVNPLPSKVLYVICMHFLDVCKFFSAHILYAYVGLFLLENYQRICFFAIRKWEKEANSSIFVFRNLAWYTDIHIYTTIIQITPFISNFSEIKPQSVNTFHRNFLHQKMFFMVQPKAVALLNMKEGTTRYTTNLTLALHVVLSASSRHSCDWFPWLEEGEKVILQL